MARGERIEVEPLIPLDLSNLDGVTVDEFVERNRKAMMVLLFQRAVAGDKEALGLVGKVVTAPYTERSKLLALSNGNAVGFEGVGGPIGKLMKDLQTGRTKMDDLLPSGGRDVPVPANAIVEHLGPAVGRHDLAVENAQRRADARSGIENVPFKRPKGLIVDGQVLE